MLLIGYCMGVRREGGLQASLALGRARYPPPLEGELIRVAHGLAQWRRGAVPRPPDFASRGGQARNRGQALGRRMWRQPFGVYSSKGPLAITSTHEGAL